MLTGGKATYNNVLSVIIQRVLKGYTIQEVDELVGGVL